MVGAGAGDQNPSRTKHFQGAKVEFLVASDGGVEVALALSEGRWVEDDGVVGLAGGGIVLEQVEGVGFHPFDLLVSVLKLRLIERCVLLGDLERGEGAIDPGDMRAPARQMKGKGSLIAEDVERIAVSVLCGDRVIFALVEKRSGFLAFEGFEVELNAVHGKDG